MVGRNHEVTLFASGDSDTQANLVSVYPRALGSDMTLSERIRNHYISLLISNCYAQSKKYDIIHSHFTLLSSFFSNLTTTPTLVSVHSPIDVGIQPLLEKMNHNYYVSFSLAQRKQMPNLNWVANIPHGIDPNTFTFNATPQDYFLYLGRVSEDKGVHLAIAAAQKAGVKLIIAGSTAPMAVGATLQPSNYWDGEVKPHIDGTQIVYVGEQDFANKITLLQNAQAVLFPSQCDEVFGYVMIEAMSCGTPVIGWNRGAIPEVIDHGKTGFVVDSVEAMVVAIEKVKTIDRTVVRQHVLDNFSLSKMVASYEELYAKIIAGVFHK